MNDVLDGDTLKIGAEVESAEFYGLYIKYILKAGNESLKVIEKIVDVRFIKGRKSNIKL